MSNETKRVEETRTLEERVKKLEAQMRQAMKMLGAIAMTRMKERKAAEAQRPAAEAENQAPSFRYPASRASGGGIMSRRKG